MNTTDLVEIVECVSRADPERLALCGKGETYSYGQLNDKIRANGRVLAAAGLEAGDRVFILADNSTEYLLAMFSVWRAGGVACTAYASSAIAEISHYVNRSDPCLIIADACAMALLERMGTKVPMIELRDELTVARTRRGTLSTLETAGAELALICFTSGSTSLPKAVMHTADSLYGGAHAYARVWHLGEADRTAVAIPMAWAYGLATAALAALAGGGTVVALPRAKPQLVAEAIAEHRVTFIPAVTTIFAKLTEYLEGHPECDLGTLRLCISGGEPRNENVFSRWERLTGVAVHDVYAASECFPVVTYDPTVDPEPKYGSAGRVVPGSGLRIIGPEGVDLPTGELGEALWRGPGMFHGYWRDEAQTAAAITDDGWYRSRDLVRLGADGYVFVEGRLTDMIIHGGANVSPSEVEDVLRTHPRVVDASVVGLPDETYGERVMAAVVLAGHEPVDERELVEHCLSRLAAFKVPSRYVAVASLPLMRSTGKVDRRAVRRVINQAS